jgi:hypothetical protein
MKWTREYNRKHKEQFFFPDKDEKDELFYDGMSSEELQKYDRQCDDLCRIKWELELQVKTLNKRWVVKRGC